jgi:2-chlorobenzoate 1,2-dioxygenase
MPDDIEVYARCQQGNLANGGDWISMHRYAGTDLAEPGGMVSVNGTSELPMRNQFAAWKQFMVAGAQAAESASGPVVPLVAAEVA